MSLFDLFNKDKNLKKTMVKPLKGRYSYPGYTNSYLKLHAENLLFETKLNADCINRSYTIDVFMTAYTKIMANLSELIFLNEKKKIFMVPSPRSNLQQIAENMEATIDDFLDRALGHLYGTGDTKADSMERLVLEIQSRPDFFSLFNANNQKRLDKILQGAQIERNRAKFYREQREKEIILQKVGFSAGLDLYNIELTEICNAVQVNLNKIHTLFTSGEYVEIKPKDAFDDFKNKCLSCKMEEASRISVCRILDNNERLFIVNGLIYQLDDLDGHTFEKACALILRNNGFLQVEVTKGSGDQGVDIVAVKNSIKYAIQCKCYSSPLGNTPVQEVYAGKAMYNCHVGVVMTNQHFTPSAIALAEKTGVLLWDRNKLIEMLKSAQ